jgi:hypothetical protein
MVLNGFYAVECKDAHCLGCLCGTSEVCKFYNDEVVEFPAEPCLVGKNQSEVKAFFKKFYDIVIFKSI